jgi:uncharacterized delta-60 repeat protein
VARFNIDGSPDTTWNGSGLNSINYNNPQGDSVIATSGIRSLAIQPDGRIVAVGGFSNILFRFNTNGSLDTSFDGDGSRQALISGREPYDLVISSGGAITVVGLRSWSILPPSLPFLYYVARYKQDGSPDLSFSDDGYLEIDISSSTVDGARAVAKDSLGRIVIAGLAGDGNPNHPFENSIFSAARLIAPVSSVGILGRVIRFDGRPVANATLTADDGAGTIITARTNPFGYYRFPNVQSGRTYTISVRAKKLVFTDRSVFVSDQIANFDFISEQP